MLSFILCESTSRWAVSWRRALRNARITCELRETRYLSECDEQLVTRPEAIVGIEITEKNLDRVLPQLGHWREKYPHAIFLLLADRGLFELELQLRDAGAQGLLFSRREVPRYLTLLMTNTSAATSSP